MHALGRTPAVVLSLILAVGAAVAPVTAAPAPARWDHPGYDAEDSYFNPHERVITAATVGRLARKWTVNLRRSDSCADFGAPVVSGGRIFVGDQAGISAYATANGAKKWSYDWEATGEAGTPRLAVADGLLIAGYNDCYSMSDPNTRLIALDAATGARRWSGTAPLIGSLVVDKGVILISSSDIYGSTVAEAHRVRDGKKLWKARNRRVGGVSADGTVVGFTTDNEGVRTGETVALDITSGAVRWTAKGHLDVGAATPAGDTFYGADARDRLAAVSVANGTVRWTAPRPEDSSESLATDGVRLYRSRLETVTAWDARTGRQVWSRKLAKYAGQPVVAGGLLYAEGVTLDAGRGTVVRRMPAFEGDIVVTGGVLYQTNEGVLRAYAP